MLFHAGALIRLNSAGLLRKLNRVSSVSGGSITAGMLGLAWDQLQFNENDVAQRLDIVIDKIRGLAGETVDEGSVLGGLLSNDTIADRVTESYAKYLFGNATLQDLPDDNAGPRFVINATNVQTGALFRFSKTYLADYRLGTYPAPSVPLAVAVAASSAFPPFLSPVDLALDGRYWQPDAISDLSKAPYTTNLVLSDGGVYDNLGLETAWKNYKTIFVSDGGGKIGGEEKPSRDWVRHSKRILDIIDNQVRSLRYRNLIASYKAPPTQADHRAGAYWGIRTNIAEYQLGDVLPCPHARTMDLANTPTRLKKMDGILQERLINWGYAVCDAALRAYFDTTLAPPGAFPFPGNPI
jgi:NTE family protein